MALYPWQTVIGTRWMDCDAYGHVNNVIYYSWMDTAVTRMLYVRGVLGPQSTIIGLCVASACEFHAPVGFPGDVTVAVAVERMGNSSIRYQVGMFVEDASALVANGQFTHVYVDRTTRKPLPLSSEIRAALADLVQTAS